MNKEQLMPKQGKNANQQIVIPVQNIAQLTKEQSLTGNLTNEQIEKAWRYYQQADSLQHQRHGIFIVAQSIFFAAFTQAPAPLRYAVAIMGALYSLFWWYLAERLSNGMNALNEKYLKEDAVYQDYLSGLNKSKLSGRQILNRILPGLTFVAWVILVVLLASGWLKQTGT